MHSSHQWRRPSLLRALLGFEPSEGLRTRIRLYLVWGAFLVTYYTAAILAGLTPRDQIMSTWRDSLVLTGFLSSGYAVTILLWTLFEMPPSYAELGTRLKKRLLSLDALERVVGILLLAAGMNLMFDVFAAFKSAIPGFQPYVWDDPLATLDHILHLGHDPWRLLHGFPLRNQITGFLDRLYALWYEITLVSFLLVLVAAPLEDRVRFFLGQVLLWGIGGSMLGTAFAAGGPVYFGHFTGDISRFEPLLTYLDGAAPIARSLQHTLWAEFLRPESGFMFEGISAMPSLHVAVAVHLALWARRLGAWASVATAGYAVLIFLGSVHLGWHYAVDGYVGAALATGAWWVSESLWSGRRTRLAENPDLP